MRGSTRQQVMRVKQGYQGLQVVRDVPKVERRHRRPQHPFTVGVVPWEITPFFIAPVLPGETMQNLLVQARYRSKALNGSLIDNGWWIEQQFYYIKHRDLEDEATDLMAMHVENAVLPQINGLNGNVDWVSMCLKAVTKWYYRNEGEAWDGYKGPTGLPLASINKNHFTQTLMFDDTVIDDGDVNHDELLPGEQERYPEEEVPAGFEGAFEQYTQMFATGYTTATFEDYLASFGIKVPRELREELHKPELIRYLRDWKYPRMAADLSGSKAACVVEDSIAERADKKRLFQEPGFLFGVCVVRPKVYYYNLSSEGGVGGMNDAFAWLPHVLSDQPFTSLKKFDADKGPLAGIFADQYWIDIRDIFTHGDQFIGGNASGYVSVGIGADGQRRFAWDDTPVDTDPMAGNYGDTPWFQLTPPITHIDNTDPEEPVEVVDDVNVPVFYFDGVVTLDVLGMQVDTTPVPGESP